MRNVQFRALDEEGRWCFGGPDAETLHDFFAGFGSEWGLRWDTLGQFTGLLDKNGKEVYQGDVVRDKKGNLWLVEFDAGSFGIAKLNHPTPDEYSDWLSMATITYSEKQVGVVGNKFENPELLN